MKLALFVCLLSSTLFAQTNSTPLTRGAKELGVFVGGGTGTGKRTNTQMLYAGGRFGYVLTPEIFSGPMRGNVEYVFDALPIFAVFQPQNAFGAGFNPFILKWNFTSGKRMVPFIEAGGGVIFTNHDIPANTNNVNFTPQGGFGIHFLRSNHRAITASAKYLHISNSGLDRRNSGINASVQFILGYTWFK
ncbi:MAG TPA: acyloxyacyl hydrolase [Terriglobales bacterium]|nr:acyloxyacyl hydrolase [Terriglobales bacterium]